MTKYKSDPPSHYPDFGQLCTPPVPVHEGHWLASVLDAAHVIMEDKDATPKIKKNAKDIIHWTRKAWDCVDE
jgi:hypothetical protein